MEGSIACNGENACCYSNEIIADSMVTCNGDYGCYQSLSIKAGSHIECNGNYGCYDVHEIQSSDGYIQCNGRYSCYGAGLISGQYVYVTGNKGAYKATINAVYDIQCGGPYACYNGVIEAGQNVKIESNYAAYKASISSGIDTNCDASYSCAYANIVSVNVLSSGYYSIYYGDITAESVLVYGYRGVAYSNVRQKEDKPLTVELYGFEAGYNTDVYCLEDQFDCNVHCRNKFSCHETTVYYLNIDTVNIEPVACKLGLDSLRNILTKDEIYCPYLVEYQTTTEAKRNREKTATKEFSAIQSKLDQILANEMNLNEEVIDETMGMKIQLYHDEDEKLDPLHLNISRPPMDAIYGIFFGGLFLSSLMCLYSKCRSKNNANQNSYQSLL